MKCTTCGAIEYSDTAATCANCGAELRRPVTLSAGPSAPASVVYTAPRPAEGMAKLAEVISVVLWVGVLGATLLSGAAFMSAGSAPQEAAALGIAVIPYVFARAWDGLRAACL